MLCYVLHKNIGTYETLKSTPKTHKHDIYQSWLPYKLNIIFLIHNIGRNYIT